MKEKKLIVHIGYPKTATSTLQLNLFSKLSKDGKIEYLNHLAKPDPNFGELKCTKIIAFVLGQTDNTDFEDEIEAITKIEKATTVISNENISFFEEKFSWAYLGHKSTINLDRIKTIFNPYYDKIEILIGLRNQATLIPSFYAEAYNMIIQEEPTFCLFENWFRVNFSSSKHQENLPFNFYTIGIHASSLFGKDNVHFLLFEELKYESELFHKKIAGLLGIDQGYVQNALGTNHKNITSKHPDGSLTSNKKTLNMILTAPFRKYLKRLDKNVLEKLRKFYHLLIPQFIRGYKTNLSDNITTVTIHDIDYINQRYAVSNLCLLKEFDLPEECMKKAGYIK
jgi:hypothetical protein